MGVATEKKMSYGDGQAIKILVSEKLGFDPSNTDIARKQLSGSTIHPINFAQLEKESTEMHNRLSKDPVAVKSANKIANEIALEHGFSVC
jgi:formate-dependent phosphoribosylglycinamide formyltransferase (GAR transformylase)